ncbi:MAG: 50S ribosomal protein L18 [bacterium]|nr:50S ribosomal protein L18 [bacterium]
MANHAKEKIVKRQRRARRIKAKILNIKKKTAGKIRLTVFRSNKHIYTQLIDNDSRKTIAAAQDKEIAKKDLESAIKEKKLSSKIAMAYLVGKLIAEKSMKKKIKEIVFDRRGYKYHGRIKALADGAREQGLKF